jgi:hypothetical protein
MLLIIVYVISDGCPKPDGHEYGYNFYLWVWSRADMIVTADIYNIQSEFDPLSSYLYDPSDSATCR